MGGKVGCSDAVDHLSGSRSRSGGGFRRDLESRAAVAIAWLGLVSRVPAWNRLRITPGPQAVFYRRLFSDRLISA